MERRSCDFPEGVLVEILSWLPPESLMRSKCVCKSWCGLINSLVKNPVFVNKHLHNIDNKILSCTTRLVFCCLRPGFCPDPELGFFCPFELFTSITISNDNCESDRLEHISEDFDLPVISGEPDMSCVLGCHCNGIVCLADYGKTLVLCNPAIMEYKALPEPCHSEHDFVTLGVGLGYDSRANDYKVVKFGGRKFQPGWSEHLKAEVYSLGSDSWREIPVHIQIADFPFPDKQVFCKGVFYWSMWANYKYVIISFDMFDEVFRRVSLPDNLQTQQCIKLAVWNESLALFLYPGERGAPISIEVWVMDDCFGGVMGSCSWTKKLTIGPLDGIATPWTFWKNDELLIEAIDGGLLSYNLRSHMLRTLGRVEKIRRWDFSYVRSLVSVHGGNQAHW